jgi:Flp pilus assembly pilin Flp
VLLDAVQIVLNGTKQVMKNTWLRWWYCDRAQDIAEYALLLAVILIIVIATASAVGGSAKTLFSKATTALSPAPK